MYQSVENKYEVAQSRLQFLTKYQSHFANQYRTPTTPAMLPVYTPQDRIIGRSELEQLLLPGKNLDRGFLLQEQARMTFDYKPSATSYSPIREKTPPTEYELRRIYGN